MKEKTLLLGNGLNRTLKYSRSWADLMIELGSTAREEDRIPYPIDFEQMAASRGGIAGNRSNDAYKQLRTKMSNIVKEIDTSDPNQVHLRFRNLGMKSVITTNYDTIFESMYEYDELLSNPGGYKNILKPIFCSVDIDFYHAHGLGRWKNTLCLSHEHYISLITKIRDTFFTDKGNENKQIISEIIRGKAKRTGTWPELLFTTDVAIVGFELDYSEIDFWWLLAQRAAIFAPCHNMYEYENTITYYCIDINNRQNQLVNPNPEQLGRMNALQALGVSVCRVTAKSYEEGYIQIADRIKQSWV